MNFSAKDLCSKSAMQIKFLRDNPNKRKVTQFMIDGSKNQELQFKNIPNALYEEMCGHYSNGDIDIYFSNDIITSNSVIEIKSVFGEYENWYLENSILQCAFYKSLIMSGCIELHTASFITGPKNNIIIPKNIDYLLKFGERIFKIDVKKPSAIIKFFLNKAQHTMNYSDAKNFDEIYKRKEYEILLPFFTFKEIE